MAGTKTLDELFHDTLKDIYFAEKKILTALPKMAKAAQNEDLQAAFEKHKEETEGQIDRLEKVFAEIDEKPETKTCDAILGILKEGEEIMKEYKGSPAHDAGWLPHKLSSITRFLATELLCPGRKSSAWKAQSICCRKRSMKKPLQMKH
jgi:ferritin-like metal-binding protein YciE